MVVLSTTVQISNHANDKYHPYTVKNPTVMTLVHTFPLTFQAHSLSFQLGNLQPLQTHYIPDWLILYSPIWFFSFVPFLAYIIVHLSQNIGIILDPLPLLAQWAQ